jgi:predicted nuclease of predicted toxin-antitoxin system
VSRHSPPPLSFCLDAGISYRVAEALAGVGVDIVHVSQVGELLTGREHGPGQCNAEDSVIAQWTVREGRILIALDDDHNSAGDSRAQALVGSGVEVIWFSEDVKGALRQLVEISRRIDGWRSRLGQEDRQPRVWVQHLNRTMPLILVGKQRRRKSRAKP